jgi:aryl sulfotransferase
MSTPVAQPQYEMHNHHFNSEKWKDFPHRSDDIVIATAYKSGTTWMQNIVLKLVYQGKEYPGDDVASLCPWLDLRVPPIEAQLPLLEAIQDRRQIKTHLRFDAVRFNPNVKYIYIGRDGRDCYMSLVNHYRKGNALWYDVLNKSPGLVGDPIPEFDEALHSEAKLFDAWISQGWPSLTGETDGYPFWSLFDNVRTWWQARSLPNVHFVHFADLLQDLSGEVRGIAEFLDIPIDEAGFPALVDSLSFASMKAECCDTRKTLVPLAGAIFNGGGDAFINKVPYFAVASLIALLIPASICT